MTATGAFTDGTTQRMNPLCQWSSSDNTIATVSPTGLVTGQSAAVATITARDGSITASGNVLVETGTVASIAVAPQTATVANNFSTAFRAMGLFNNGDIQDLTNFVNWTSSNSNTAVVSNTAGTTGFATGLSPVTSTITATYSGQSGSATLNVSNATLTLITMTPSSMSISVGPTQVFTATGTFGDGSSLDITGNVAWASSTTSVATINSAGVAQGVAPGTSTISASAAGVTGTAVLTVQ